jgi:sucrose-6-phosphate hydrolase SacC (GH32 family)
VTYNRTIFASADFFSWYKVGQQVGFGVGECPSLFVLPRSTPGSGKAPAGATEPTHVYKESHSWADFMQVGTYRDGAPGGHVGVWIPSTLPLTGNRSRCIDQGAFYAAKDAIDHAGRRLYWGWTAYTPPAQGVISLPRELTWNPELRQLVHTPVPELSALRDQPAIAELSATVLKPGEIQSFGSWKGKDALQAEVDVTFQLPAHNASFGVVVMADAKVSKQGMLFWAEYFPNDQGSPHHVLTVGSTNLSISALYQRVMPDLDLCCFALPNMSNVTSYRECQRECDLDSGCHAWTYKPTGACTKRSSVANAVQTLWRAPIPSKNTTSGVKQPSLLLGGRTATVQLAPTDTNFSIHVFVDQVMAEGFWQSGRAAMTRECDAALASGPLQNPSVGLFASTEVVVQHARAWRLHDAWISADELLRTPRLPIGDE